MTQLETSTTEAPQTMSSLGAWVRIGVGGVGASICTGVFTGILKGSGKHGGPGVIDFALLAIAALAALALAWFAWTGVRALLADGAPMGQRERTSRRLIWASIVIGVVTGFALTRSKPDDLSISGRIEAVLHGPISPLAVGIGWIVLLVILALSYKWHRTIDEHEAAAYNFGGIVSLYAYFAVTVGWWLLWRGGYVPEPDAMAIFIVVAFVWTFGWLWKRS